MKKLSYKFTQSQEEPNEELVFLPDFNCFGLQRHYELIVTDQDGNDGLAELVKVFTPEELERLKITQLEVEKYEVAQVIQDELESRPRPENLDG